MNSCWKVTANTNMTQRNTETTSNPGLEAGADRHLLATCCVTQTQTSIRDIVQHTAVRRCTNMCIVWLELKHNAV